MKNQKLSISGRIGVLTGVIVLAAISSLIVYGATGQTNQVKNCYENKTEARCKADINGCYWYDGICHDSENPTELKNSPFDEYKTERIDNILSGEKWDQLMDLLNRVDELTVPAGAIMAFDSKDGCPDGWEEWHESDGRFLMGGVTDQIGDVGGRSKMKLTKNELPPHNHGIYYREDWNVGDDGNKYPPILEQYGSYPSNKLKIKNTTEEGNGEEFSILNPYYKVIFCKKSDNVEPVNAACSSNKFECEQGVLEIGSEEGGGHLDYQSKWICRGINGGSDKYCIKCISPDYSIRNVGKQNQQCYLNGKCYVGSGRQEILQKRCAAGNNKDDYNNKNLNGLRWNCEGIGIGATTDYCLLCKPGYPYLYKDINTISNDDELSKRGCSNNSHIQDNGTYTLPYWYGLSVGVFHYVRSHDGDDFPRQLVDDSYSLSID